MMKSVVVNNLYKIYNEKQANEFYALKNINLVINRGDIIILKGKSGSGKSTLLSILGGLSKPSSGSILVDDENITKLPDIFISNFRNEKVGFVFQSFNLIDGLSTYDNVLAPLVLKNLSYKEIDNRVNLALELANIKHKSKQKVCNLSGGEKQRCAIARALVMNPDLILADEPTANLDKSNSLVFVEMLKKFRELKKSVVVATHDDIFDNLDFVTKYIDINDGEIV